MNFSTLKRTELIEICKNNNIKGYSKLAKKEIIEVLNKTSPLTVVEAKENDSVDTTAVVSTENNVPKAVKVENLGKKLERSIPVDLYKNKLEELEPDADDEQILNIFKDKVDTFIKSDDITNEEYKRYVTKYGILEAIQDYNNMDEARCTKLLHKSENDIYKSLARLIYKNDANITENLLKKFRKSLTIMHKNKAAAVETDTNSQTSSTTKSPSKEDDNETEETDDE